MAEIKSVRFFRVSGIAEVVYKSGRKIRYPNSKIPEGAFNFMIESGNVKNYYHDNSKEDNSYYYN